MDQAHQEKLVYGIQQPAQQLPTIASAVAVPALQALLVGVAIAVLGGGLFLLFGAAWLLAGKVAIAGWLLGTSGSVVYFVGQERAVHTTAALVARAKLRLAAPMATPEPDTPAMIIRPYRARPALAATVEKTVDSIEPEVDAETRRLYQFVCGCWDGGAGNLSRDAVRQQHGITRSVWEKYVGGRRGRAGAESAKGLLHRANVVEQTSTGWQWRDGVSLQDVFAITPELLSYADAKAKMVSGGRDRTDRTGQDGDVVPSEPSRRR